MNLSRYSMSFFSIISSSIYSISAEIHEESFFFIHLVKSSKIVSYSIIYIICLYTFCTTISMIKKNSIKYELTISICNKEWI